jgi:hypothetical protein
MERQSGLFPAGDTWWGCAWATRHRRSCLRTGAGRPPLTWRLAKAWPAVERQGIPAPARSAQRVCRMIKLKQLLLLRVDN